jgi:hypothetical protein
LSEYELSSYVDGTLSSSEIKTVVEHLADCTDCLDLVGFLVRSEDHEAEVGAFEASSREGEKTARTSQSRWVGNLWRKVAASVILVTGLSIIAYQLYEIRDNHSRQNAISEPIVSQVRGPEDAAAVPQILYPKDASIIARSNPEIGWTEINGAYSYTVELLSSGGDLVWKTETAATESKIPDQVELINGNKYFLSVRAHLPDGRSLRAPAVGLTFRDD